MRLLIAIKSCARDRALHQAIRDTWGKDFGSSVEVVFFMGGAAEGAYPPDEVVLGCDDSYEGLPAKTRAICHWAWDYDYIFLCDNDTFVKPDKLLALPFRNYDYSGFVNDGRQLDGSTFKYWDERGNYYQNAYPWASGGVGYFLSNLAADLIGHTTPPVWAEDMGVGQILGPTMLTKSHIDVKNKAAWHLLKTPKYPTYTPAYMHEVYDAGGPAQHYLQQIYFASGDVRDRLIGRLAK